jgi:hypothetical protein
VSKNPWAVVFNPGLKEMETLLATASKSIQDTMSGIAFLRLFFFLHAH